MKSTGLSLDQIDSYEEPREMSPLHNAAMAKKLFKEVWSRVPQKSKAMLSMPQNVYLLYTSSLLAHKKLINGKVVVLPSAPSVLYWIDDTRTDFQFKVDVLEAYYAQSAMSDLGIRVGEQAFRILNQRVKLLGKVEASQVIVFRLEAEELILLFSTKSSHLWKKSLSALIKSFLQSYQKFQEHAIPLASPRDPHQLERSFGYDTENWKVAVLGNIYDITTSENPEESNSQSVWINIKLTCIAPSGQTNEEYLVYDKNQDDLAQTTSDTLVTLTEKLDVCNLMIFKHFLEEMEMMEMQKKQVKMVMYKRQRKYQDEVFSSLEQSLTDFLLQDHSYDWVCFMQCNQFDRIYHNYLEYDQISIKRMWNYTMRKPKRLETDTHPCLPLFHLLELENLSLQLSLAKLLSSESGSELLQDIEKLIEVTHIEQEEIEQGQRSASQAKNRSCETCVIS